MSKDHTQTRRWVTDKFLSDYYQVSRVTIWGWSKSGHLPPPEKIGPNTTRWDFQKIVEAEKSTDYGH